jgi:endoglucanase Acf2
MNTVALGLGSYLLDPPAGHETPPRRIYRSDTLLGPMPTGRWWSSAAWEQFSQPMYPHPLAVQAGIRGLGIDSPSVSVGIDEQFKSQSVLAQYACAFTIAADGAAFTETLVDGFSDWSVTLLFAAAGRTLRTTLAHGSPFVFVRCDRLHPRLELSTDARIWHNDAASIGFSVRDRAYAAFAPPGTAWQYEDGQLAPDVDIAYLSVAVLPEESADALALFAEVAHSHLVDTHVGWGYDEPGSAIHANYCVKTEPLTAQTADTLLALYPHQWRALDDESKLTRYGYDTVRGRMKLARGTGFETTLHFPGALPLMPTLDNETERLRALVEQLGTEGDHHLANLWPHAERDMYWTGVSLNRVSALVPIAQRVGADAVVAELIAWLKATLEEHFQAKDCGGQVKTEQVYWYDELWTTVIGYPGGFGAHTELNDHHYQYAYWIRAALEIARHDPDWIERARWGGMIDLLVRDIATGVRDDAQFPFIRHFDIYAGHSWATGRQQFVDGANAESSSEAIAAWAAVLLWGEFTGDRELRDLGAYLYTTEICAAEEYWFDIHRENLPPDYGLAMVGQVWGGKSSYSTWWTDDPEAMRGISFIPLTTTSFYLGRHPDYVQANLADLRRLRDPWSYWPDIFWAYEALTDPTRALELYDNAAPDYTEGHSESRPHTLSWILDLTTLGQVDRGIGADTALYAVFRKDLTRTYVAFNAGDLPRTVTFSDGATIDIGAHRGRAVSRRIPGSGRN